jgi:hypothetical protein
MTRHTSTVDPRLFLETLVFMAESTSVLEVEELSTPTLCPEQDVRKMDVAALMFQGREAFKKPTNIVKRDKSLNHEDSATNVNPCSGTTYKLIVS